MATSSKCKPFLFKPKSDLGVHIDGYIALVAHTVVVGATAQNPASGKAADAILAAWNSL